MQTVYWIVGILFFAWLVAQIVCAVATVAIVRAACKKDREDD